MHNSVNKQNMAQSAVDSGKTPLHIDAFWEKPTTTLPLFVWQMDAAMETGLVGQRGDTIVDTTQWTTHNGRTSRRTCVWGTSGEPQPGNWTW